MESLQERCDMVVTLFVEEQSGSSMVRFCTFCSRGMFRDNACQEGTAVVSSGECVGQPVHQLPLR